MSVIVSFIIFDQNLCKFFSNNSQNCDYSYFEDNIKKASFTIDLVSWKSSVEKQGNMIIFYGTAYSNNSCLIVYLFQKSNSPNSTAMRGVLKTTRKSSLIKFSTLKVNLGRKWFMNSKSTLTSPLKIWSGTTEQLSDKHDKQWSQPFKRKPHRIVIDELFEHFVGLALKGSKSLFFQLFGSYTPWVLITLACHPDPQMGSFI